jgi:hypothetical protein
MRRGTLRRLLVGVVVTGAVAALGMSSAVAGPAHASPATKALTAAKSSSVNKSEACAAGPLMCAEVADYKNAFNYYTGHDEPSVLYYSNTPGAGNRNQWQLTLPREPSPTVVPGRSWDFQLTPAIWFGMAMCDTQSYPEQVGNCTPDSDANITPLAQHPGTAFMELQFYPPGWVKQFASQSCDARNWCAALTIDSLSEDPVNGLNLNRSCQSSILGGIEYVNFAFLTHSGKPIAAPNPLQFNPATGGNPTNPDVLFMRQGDHIKVTMHDTAHGLRTVLNDTTTGAKGFMTASAANGFGQIKFAPRGSSCTELPYDFHPMYSTSSPQTRVPWAAHSYNIAFDEEIGHFDYCTRIAVPTGTCNGGLEGAAGDQEATDADDVACFPASASLLVRVSGCNGTNAPGFDGTSYLNDWPDGNTSLHPTPELFSSPLTGSGFGVNYTSAAFESDTPRIEAPDVGGVCNRTTGVGCTIVPPTDDGQPATFYPFFSITGSNLASGCRWLIGNDVPGLTANDFGKTMQYGKLLPLQYLVFGGGGATLTRFNDFQNNLGFNPCKA